MRTALTGVVVIALMGAWGCGKSVPTPEKSAATAGAGVASAAGAATVTDKPSAEKPAAEPAGPPKKILLWHAYRDKERQALDTLLVAWNNKHPEIQVTALAVPFDALVDKVQVTVPRGNGPDLIIFAHDKIGAWSRDRLIQPLGEWATKDRLRRFLPQTVMPLVFERAVYGLPVAFKSLVLFYNKALVETPPTTMAELIEMAKKHTDAKGGKFGLGYDSADLYQHAAILHAYGGRVWDDAAGAMAIDSPGAVEALMVARDLHKKHKIVPKGLTGFVITAMFNDGNVPFVFNGPWFVPEIDPKVKWGVALMPKAPNSKPLTPYLGSEALLLSAKTKEREAALTIIDYLTSDEAALVRLQKGSQLVANRKIYENARWAGDPVIKVFRAQAEISVPMPNAAEANVAWQPYGSALRKVIFGDAKAADALKAAAAQADAALAKRGKQ